MLKQETESLEKSLRNFQQLLISFESEIDSVQFWFNKADDCSEAKRTLLKKIVVKNNYQSSLIEVDLEKGLYCQEELTLDEFKSRLEEHWKKIAEEYQKTYRRKSGIS